MKCKIIFLKPRGGFKTKLYSDTLWSTLCWGIRLLHGNDALEKFINQYESLEASKEVFFISSAFPYKVIDEKRVCYFPSPLKPIDESLDETGNFVEDKHSYRKRKTQKKAAKELQSYGNYLVTIGAKQDSNELKATFICAPKLEGEAITHNTINRTTGSTLTVLSDTGEQAGQLFHVEELQVVDKKGLDEGNVSETGLFFLAHGNTSYLEGVLRFLGHIGIGGDRSIGKGRFDISIHDFELPEPDKPNVVTNLSLYRPTTQEVGWMKQKTHRFFVNYDTIYRKGKGGFLRQKPFEKQGLILFKEGATFPINSDFGENPIVWGTNTMVGQADTHSIWQYGYGFMVKMKI